MPRTRLKCLLAAGGGALVGGGRAGYRLPAGGCLREAWAGGRATGRVLGAEGHGGFREASPQPTQAEYLGAQQVDN